MILPDPADAIAVPGAWTHRTVSANGARFHLVEAGSGPLVLLLHGFPMYWYTWRTLVPQLAEAGYRAVAIDLRGYGGSDKTPHGYDPLSLATDILGVVRSLGARDAVVVGHGWGGLLAWTLASTNPDVVRAIAPVSMPHPNVLREALLRNRAQRRAARYVWGYQVPILPERRLVHDDASTVGRILRERSAHTGWLDDGVESTFRAAMLATASAHCALEYHRWAIRSIPRRDGRVFTSVLESPVAMPVLQVHGLLDPSILLSSVAGSADFATGPYVECVLDTGHHPHEESPHEFGSALTGWLTSLG